MSTPSSDPRPAESLSALTRTLSESFASEDGALLLARLQALSLAARLPAQRPSPVKSGRIGVETAALEKGGARELVRDPAQAAEWRFWADVERIAPKRKRRVVLLGESVARGYLYDPASTPAGVLASMLPGREVVDLARTDLTMMELGGLLGGLQALEPDTIVLFAGNNWHNVGFELPDVARLAAAVRERGFAGTRRVFMDEMVRPRARALMDALAATARDLGAKVVVVVPEFNLRDWRSEPTVLAPVLPGEDNAVWLAAHTRGWDAMGRGDLEAAAAAAGAMIDLDEGTSSSSQELLAAVLIARGRTAEARARLEAARDAAFGLLAPHSPRCPAEVQDVLRGKSAEHGFALVDLPRVFARAQDGELPDRRLFLDYCHLTRAGIQLAMAEVAARLRRPAPSVASGQRPRPSSGRRSGRPLAGRDPQRALRSVRGGPPPSLRASAGAFARRCGSHAGLRRFPSRPGREVDERVVRRPVRASRDRPVPVRLGSTPHGEARRLRADRGHGLLPRGGGRARACGGGACDGGVGRIGSDRLAAAVPARDDVPRARHPRPGRGARLHAGLHAHERVLPDPAAGGSGVLPADLPVARRPRRGHRRHRGRHDVRLAVEDHWQTFEFELHAPKGLSRVTLEWPVRPPPPDSLERAARRLERGAYPDVFPWFGEVHAFTAWRRPEGPR